MQNNTIIDETMLTEEHQVFVTDITWSKDTVGKFRAKHDTYDQLPKQMTFVLPDSILKKEFDKDFYDIVETFVYNLLVKRFNHMPYHCQTWLVWDNGQNAAV